MNFPYNTPFFYSREQKKMSYCFNTLWVWMLVALVLGISGVIHLFSLTFMAGERHLKAYFLKLLFVTGGMLLWILTHHLVIFVLGWLLSQVFWASLMIHHQCWRKYSLWGVVGLVVAATLLAYYSETFSIDEILERASLLPRWVLTIALMGIALAVLMQAGVWPFHRWLISSLNVPTPAMALLHGGLVGGGAILLIRFSGLFHLETRALGLFFVLGLMSAVLGTLWKWVQSSVKKRLACSTVAHMGCIFMEWSLGFFSLAIIHLCLHGICKGFFILNSGASLQKKKSRPFFSFEKRKLWKPIYVSLLNQSQSDPRAVTCSRQDYR
jgi:NAD(P)H-quinone oxidoreductase subunit 5